MNRLPSRRPFPLPYSKLKLATMHIKTFLLQSLKQRKGGVWKKSYMEVVYICCSKIHFGKHELSQDRDEGFNVVGLGIGRRRRLCGMKYMHEAQRGQQADKLTTPQPWHHWHLSALCPCFYSLWGWEEDIGRRDWGEGVFTLGSFGQLGLIWDLQVTLCPHGCLLTRPGLWSETVGSFPCD